jgi:hypothetical protein
MEAILRDLIQTHRIDLTQRTGTKTVSVKGQSIELARVKRYMRRKGLSQSDVEQCPDTQASQTGSTTCSSTSLPFSSYEMNRWPHFHAPNGHAWQSILERSNYVGSYPLDLSFGNDTAPSYRFMLGHPDSTGHKRTRSSTSDRLSTPGEERQPKRQRSSPPTPTFSNYACTFYKNNPSHYNPQNPDVEIGRRYRSCAGPGWTSIRRLKCVKVVSIGCCFLTD